MRTVSEIPINLRQTHVMTFVFGDLQKLLVGNSFHETVDCASLVGELEHYLCSRLTRVHLPRRPGFIYRRLKITLFRTFIYGVQQVKDNA